MKRIFSLFLLTLTVQLSCSLTWSFPATTISSSGLDAADPQLGSDSSGNLVSVWIENDRVVAKTKLLSGSWSSLSTLSGTGGNSPSLAVAPNGDATVLWVEGGLIKTARKPFGQSWSASQTISASGSSAPNVAVDASGNLVAVWETSGVIKASTKLVGGSWSLIPDTLSSIAASDTPQVSISSSGVVVAVWHAVNPVSSIDTIYAARKSSLLGIWSSAQTISNCSQNSIYPKIATDSLGRASAIWFRFNLSGSDYTQVMPQSSSLDAGGIAWSSPVDLSLIQGERNPADFFAKIAYDNSGNVIAAWTLSDDGSLFNVQSSTKDFGQNWNEPVDLAIDLYALSFDLSTTPLGGVFAVYMLTDSAVIAVQAAESQTGGEVDGFWSAQTTLSTESANNFPVIASALTDNTTHNIAAAWIAYDGSNNVLQAVQASEEVLQPPINLMVEQTPNNFGVFTEYVNTLTWDASPSAGITNYLIYRNNILVSRVSDTTFEFIDHNRIENQPVAYQIVATDDTHRQSSAAIINFP